GGAGREGQRKDLGRADHSISAGHTGGDPRRAAQRRGDRIPALGPGRRDERAGRGRHNLDDVPRDRYLIPLVSAGAILATLLTSQFGSTTLSGGDDMGFSQSSESVSVVAQGGEGGGAALDQVIGMSVVALIVTVGLLWIGYLHRQRRITWPQRPAERA